LLSDPERKLRKSDRQVNAKRNASAQRQLYFGESLVEKLESNA